MDYWTSGPGWQQLAADLVAEEQRGRDERATRRPKRRRAGRARRAVAAALLVLAARLAPAAAPVTGVATPARP